MSSWQDRLVARQEKVKALYRSVRHNNATCFIVFSAVLPRGCDWQHTQELYMAFSRFLCQFAREKRCGCMPTFTSFIQKDGPKKGRPIEGLFAIRDRGLHLNLVGARSWQTISKWPYLPGSCTAWQWQRDPSTGVGFVRWADGARLLSPTLGKEWYESRGPSYPPGFSWA